MVPDRKPRGYRGILLAFGLVAFPLSGQAQEEAQSEQGQTAAEQEPTQTLPIPIPVDIIEDEAASEARERSEAEARQRDIDDLIAQQGMNAATQAMNDATQRMAFYSLLSTILVGIGTGLLFVTLWLTYMANRAAQNAVEVTREIGQKQLRAYIGAPGGGLRLDIEKHRVWGTVLFDNFGQTPAKDVRTSVELKLLKHDEIMDSPDPKEGRDTSKSVISPGQKVTISVAMSFTDEELIAVREKTKAFFVRGRITYRTIFNAQCYTHVSYRMFGKEHPYVEVRPDVVGWAFIPTDYGNDVT